MKISALTIARYTVCDDRQYLCDDMNVAPQNN